MSNEIENERWNEAHGTVIFRALSLENVWKSFDSALEGFFYK
jgi:hypothetical protein